MVTRTIEVMKWGLRGRALVSGSIAALGWSYPAVAQTPPEQEPGAAPRAAPAKPASADAPTAETRATEPTSEPTAARLDAIEARLEAAEARASAAEASARAADERARAAEEAARKADVHATEAEASAASALDLAGEEEAATSDSHLRLYGYADMAFKKNYIPENTRFSGLADRSSTFALGNVNLYLDAAPNDQFRMLTEVRFTLYPYGNLDDSLEPTNTGVYDATSATGRNRVYWSGIVLERAHIEWTRFDAFRVLAGYFLTPYGIWNVDHGSPTLISSVLPSFWASEYFPTRQLGVQVLGDVFVDSWQLGYRAYVSNGRSPGQLDVDQNKHLGAQLYAQLEKGYVLKFGTSGFWGENAYFEKEIEGFDPFRISSEKNVEYTEFGVAADVAFDYGPLRVRAEWVLNQEEYTDGLREQTSPVTAAADRTRWNTYGIVSYRTGLWGLEPFIYLEHDAAPGAESNESNVYSGGLITHLAAGTMFKFQAFYLQFVDDETFANASASSFPGWDARLVTTF